MDELCGIPQIKTYGIDCCIPFSLNYNKYKTFIFFPKKLIQLSTWKIRFRLEHSTLLFINYSNILLTSKNK